MSIDTSERTVGVDAAAGAEPWWKSAVVYQVYPRSFADSDGDGIGDLRGVLNRLDYLQDLGVDVVWMSPIYPSPGDDNGYDISDYQQIDPLFGTLTDFDELVAQLHSRSMRLLLDLVVNHTSDEHPWFQRSLASADPVANPLRDWYIWRPARAGKVAGQPGAEPNNWGSFFSGSAWQYDPASGEYYLHLFSRKQPDLNWENPAVRQAIHQMMGWWLDRGVDGFRMDVVNLLSKDQRFPDGIVPPGSAFGDGFPHYGYGPRIHEFLSEMRAEVFAGRPDVYLTVGETPGATVEHAQRYTAPGRAELDMVFQFEHLGVDHGPAGKWDPATLEIPNLVAAFDRWQVGLAAGGWNSLYWNNHDQPRVVSRFGDDEIFWRESATALATVLHLQRGTPYIYQGEELGMTNQRFASIADVQDIEALRYYAEATTVGRLDPEEAMDRVRRIGRDNARTPMQWTDGAAAGFTVGTPWLAVNENHRHINAAAQRGVPGSVFEYYRTLIDLRHREDVVAYGDFTMLDPGQPDVMAFRREYSGDRLVVIGNLSSAPVSVQLAETAGAAMVLDNYPDVAVPAGDGRWQLRPWEAVVLRLADEGSHLLS